MATYLVSFATASTSGGLFNLHDNVIQANGIRPRDIDSIRDVLCKSRGLKADHPIVLLSIIRLEDED